MGSNIGLTPKERTQLHAQTDEQRSATLQRLIMNEVEGRPLDDRSVNRAQAVVNRYAEFLQRHGIDFPKLTFIVLPARGHFELVRADLDHVAIQVVARNLVEKFKGIGSMELFGALKRAFPDYTGKADYVPRGGAALLEANDRALIDGAVNGHG